MYKLLIADDDKQFIERLKKHINFAEFDIELSAVAHNGSDGLRRIAEYNPHIVISDIDMPEMTGLEMIGELRKTTYSPLVILLTGLDDFSYAQKAIYHNVFAYLTKPVFPNELCKTLRRAVSKLSIDGLYNAYELKYLLEHRNANEVLTLANNVAEKITRLKVYDEEELKKSVFDYILRCAETFSVSSVADKYKSRIFSQNDTKTISEIFKEAAQSICSVSDFGKLTIAGKAAEKARKYTDEHFSDSTLSINSLSELFNISPNYLRILFKDIYGISFKEYLTQKRLEEANRLLAAKEYKIYEIAAMVGYNDVYTFRSTYKKKFGHTPSEL